MVVSLPFTPDEFFDVFGAYNRLLWPFVLGLWLYALAGVVVLGRSRDSSRFIATLLAVQWAWAGLAYHATFFTRINPAAWLFGGLFLLQSALFVWFGIVRNQLHFLRFHSPRHFVAWPLLVYALIYPVIVLAEGHTFPEAPTFGVPCPTTLLTVGFLFAATPPWPRSVAVIPALWAFIAGSAASLLDVRADLMLWLSGAALSLYVLIPALPRVRARHSVERI
jgi:hypothetical protein